MDDQNKNLILAMVLSALVLIIWTVMFPPPPPSEQTVAEGAETSQAQSVPSAGTAPTTQTAPEGETAAVAVDAGKVTIKTPSLDGSISLVGGRINQLALKNYNETLNGSNEVTILSPIGTAKPYYALFGWVHGGELTPEDVPTADTIWAVETGVTLAPDTPVTLRWDSPAGLIFRRTIEVDDRFLFTVKQIVENPTQIAHRLAPFGLVARHGEPQDLSGFFIIHEGAIRRTDGELEEIDYSDMPDLRDDEVWGANASVEEATEGGWVGFTDHFWMTTLIPEQGSAFRSTSKYFDSRDLYQAEAVMPLQTVTAGASTTVTTRLFAGAKEWDAIRDYETEEGVTGFLDSIDWGWFFFLTKPIFWLLHNLNLIIGNMGWSIIALTFILKALVLPLAYKSYVSMAKMKELQPEMEALKERTGEDRQAMQQGMMKLYKDNKVNPAAGCLPILLQIPIFFSLYKVIFVTIELRHAPWLGWINDLSAPDSSSLINLFGILPWDAPEPSSILALIFIGIMPIVLGVSMWLQQKLNPAPTDPTQKMIFAWMPWVFMFMLGGFASGLVLYWITNNVITFGQQYIIMRSHGAKPDLFGNITSSFKKSAEPEAANKSTKPKDK